MSFAINGYIFSVRSGMPRRNGIAIEGKWANGDYSDPALPTSFHPLFPRSRWSSSSQRASETYLGFLASSRRAWGEPELPESAPLFSFSLLPRGAVSPYIYLIAPRTTSRSSAPYHPYAALAYSRSRALCASIIRAVSLPALACPRNN